jgi:hypothetical protein
MKIKTSSARSTWPGAPRLRIACAAGLLWLLVLALPAAVEAQFGYAVTNGTISISGYGGPGGAVSIPSAVNGLPVTSIGNDAFSGCTSLTEVTLPGSVSSIGEAAFMSCTGLVKVTIGDSVLGIAVGAFRYCTSLTSVYFQGNAPLADSSAFEGDDYLTVYYLPGTTGWGPFFADRPTVLWNPRVQTGNASFGAQTNQFGFTITGTSNIVVVVEASANLANPIWSPLQTNTLTGASLYFSDPQWTNYPARFYRLRSP